MNLLIHGYKFQLTSFACPEQYEVYDDEGNHVAYIRLRHGNIKVHFPDYGGEIIYDAITQGDGAFVSKERMKHLRLIAERIQELIANKNCTTETFDDTIEQ